jgi:hypothetical protein
VSEPDTRKAKTVLFGQYVDPLLAGLGFERVRRTYRFAADNGDRVVVDFQTAGATSKQRYEFYVNLEVVPLPWLDWLRSRLGEVAPGPGTGLLERRLQPPDWNFARWVIDTPDSAHVVGQLLTELLTPQIEELTSLLDRATFLRRLRGDGPPLDGVPTKLAAEVIMLVDQGMTDELARLLDQLDEVEKMKSRDEPVENPEEVRSKFATWARRRTNQRHDTVA